MAATTRQCGPSAQCRQLDTCPAAKADKERLQVSFYSYSVSCGGINLLMLQGLRRGSAEFKQLLKQIRESICNKAEKGVCCPRCEDRSVLPSPVPRTVSCTQSSRSLCLVEAECPAAQRLKAEMKGGNRAARQKLISMICNRKERTFCCPPDPVTTTEGPRAPATPGAAAWLPGKEVFSPLSNMTTSAMSKHNRHNRGY